LLTTGSEEGVEKNWRPREHGREVVDFANSRKECSLFAFFDGNGNLQVQKQAPHLGQQWGKVAYFARPATMHALEANELDERVNFGLVNENVMECMLHTLSNVYVPQLLSSQEWPESVKKDFTSQLHKFMANLTESAYEAKNQTVLYKPNEEISDPEEAAPEGDGPEESAPDAEEVHATIEGLDARERIESLPESGKQATVHTVLGKHASKASRIAQERGRSGGIDLNMYLLQQVLTVEGEQLRMEEVRQLPWTDLQLLLQAAGIVQQEGQGANPL